MPEDMSFGDWSGVTPEKIKTFSEAKLQYAMELDKNGVYGRWAMNELARRRDEKVAALMKALGDATQSLIAETELVHREVGLLANSSTRLEDLTKTLRNLTWVLIVLTVLAAIVPIGIEVWKASR